MEPKWNIKKFVKDTRKNSYGHTALKNFYTMAQETSIQAYEGLDLGERQTQVYNALKEIQPATNTMLAKHLKLPINCITGRIHELRNKLKKVSYAYTDLCPITKRKAMFWKII